MDFSSLTPPYRGSGFFEFWLSAVGSWIGLGGVLFHSHPSYLYFLTSLITFVLHIPIILLLFLSPPLRSAHLPLGVVPLGLTALTVIFALLSNYLVRRAKRREGERICRMLTDAAGRERGAGEEGTARALVGIQGKGIWGGFVSFISGIVGLIAGLAGVVLVTLLLIDLSITAYDHGIALPSIHSRLVSVHPKNTPWATQVHLACMDPPANLTRHQSLTRKPKTLPTVLYEPPSGVPGSLALLSTPLPPAGESAENPGRWILDLQAAGEVGRVCVWDRPGYGFSEVMSTADLGDVADALWAALSEANEAKSSFALIGEGYGGLVSRIFASRHPKSIHSLLHIEAQTAQTYFNESPRGLSPISLLTHRIATRLLPSLITPLSLTRLPSILLRRSDSLSRILASTHPLPSTERLNENLRKARLQETWGSHSHTSASFRALLGSGQNYPRDAPAIVISSQERMDGDETWAEGQRGLAEEVTGEDGLVEWLKVDGDTKWVCEGEGRAVCEESLRKLLGT
ncbi:hypothetical protein BCR39DRAFT_132887 [Naematelia encephala]|uniref:Alpha/Beta hydrolase protein n=1 Tax=Naematelia encephala TaxID=71784 RepID=A0A1Y2BJ60_9TREE|nr:hypothetical protein BCR39DRAFT_132887 [Naematelia encephala]